MVFTVNARSKVFCSEEISFLRLTALRYLAGILEMSTFWVYESYQLHSVVARMLIHGTIQLIEDLIMDSFDILEIDQAIDIDTGGIDLLTESILVSVQGWIRRKVVDDAKFECWFDDFDLILSGATQAWRIRSQDLGMLPQETARHT
jgi:hypothetical protein